MLTRVLYASAIRPGLSALDFERLVESARRRNRQLDLTGALLVCDGHFVQALEGQATAIDEMMAKILLDPRHQDVRILERSAIGLRMFADWDMGFIDDSRCSGPVDDLLQGRTAPGQFLPALRTWVDERKEAPL